MAEDFTNPQVAKEVEANVRAYHAAFAEARYKDAVALMAAGMTVYSPYGVLQTVVPDKAATVKVYEEIHAQGFRLQETPQYIRIQALPGNVAVATYLTEGTGVAPGSERVEQTLRRATQVWHKSEGGWNIVHMHVSNLQKLALLSEEVAG